MGTQGFGPAFNLEKLFRARETARALTHELAASLRPGMTEADAHRIYKELSQKHEIQKQWHPAKLRMGPNTLKTFREESLPYVLQDEDIFFVDIGPVIEGHEADYGDTFTIGSEFGHKHIAEAARKVFREVGAFWIEKRCGGHELYEFAKAAARKAGYELNMNSDGHRIGDFPHHVHFKGGLPEITEEIIPNAWILEIHLADPSGKFGAFFEDILTDESFSS